MAFTDDILNQPRPERIRDVRLPATGTGHPSPNDWRNEILYFLLPDRFSDGRESERPLLDRRNLGAARRRADGQPWRWDHWAQSGATRWQGGTLAGVISKLDYLKALGATTLWIGPIYKQRRHGNTYHGYAIQDFLDVDPRLGTRADLVALVRAAHDRGLRILLDVIFNHSGTNWLYPADVPGGAWLPRYRPWPEQHPFGAWLDGEDRPVLHDGMLSHPDDGIWPREFQQADCYTRAGSGSLNDNAVDDPNAEHKRTDFHALRDFDVQRPDVLADLIRCYQYWIALTDCDGFRIDTLKHVSLEAARQFCSAIKEYAALLGKHDFFLVGEVGGGDRAQARYLDVLGPSLNGVLDIGDMRPTLGSVAKGLHPPRRLWTRFGGSDRMAHYRSLGNRHVSVVDDHDHISGSKVRFGVDAGSEHQVVAAVALQYFTSGIPCLYMGMEQALAGPEPGQRRHLPSRWRWGHADVYLREAMFGPMQPRGAHAASFRERDPSLPGFGPFGTCGQHCFDPQHPAYRRLAELAQLRQRHAVLRTGRLCPREIALAGGSFRLEQRGGELMAWSRILDGVEALCVVNTHGRQARSADVAVDHQLCPPGSLLTVAVYTGLEGSSPGRFNLGQRILVEKRAGAPAFVRLRDVPPSEVVVLLNGVVP
jgi:glycosidase